MLNALNRFAYMLMYKEGFTWILNSAFSLIFSLVIVDPKTVEHHIQNNSSYHFLRKNGYELKCQKLAGKNICGAFYFMF